MTLNFHYLPFDIHVFILYYTWNLRAEIHSKSFIFVWIWGLYIFSGSWGQIPWRETQKQKAPIGWNPCHGKQWWGGVICSGDPGDEANRIIWRSHNGGAYKCQTRPYTKSGRWIDLSMNNALLPLEKYYFLERISCLNWIVKNNFILFPLFRKHMSTKYGYKSTDAVWLCWTEIHHWLGQEGAW